MESSDTQKPSFFSRMKGNLQFRSGTRRTLAIILVGVGAVLSAKYVVVAPFITAAVNQQQKHLCESTWYGYTVADVAEHDPSCLPYIGPDDPVSVDY